MNIQLRRERFLHVRLLRIPIYTANFFPENSYVLRVKGAGFKRNQIRLMMGVLFDLGSGKVTLDFIKKTLDPTQEKITLEHIVPGSGLILNEVRFLEE